MDAAKRREIVKEALANAQEALLRAEIDLVAYEAAGEEEAIDPKKIDVAKWERVIAALEQRYAKDLH